MERDRKVYMREWMRRYRLEHREEHLAYRRRNYQQNRLKILARQSAAYRANPEPKRTYRLAYYDTHTEEIKNKNRAYKARRISDETWTKIKKLQTKIQKKAKAK